MRIRVFFILPVFFLVQNSAFGDEVDLMGCKWNFPKRSTQTAKNVWESSTETPLLIFFENDFFDQSFVDISISPSSRKQKISLQQIDGGYELVVFSEYLTKNESVIFPSWIVIKNGSDKGVIYIDGLGGDELIDFVSSCMPNIK